MTKLFRLFFISMFAALPLMAEDTPVMAEETAEVTEEKTVEKTEEKLLIFSDEQGTLEEYLEKDKALRAEENPS